MITQVFATPPNGYPGMDDSSAYNYDYSGIGLTDICDIRNSLTSKVWKHYQGASIQLYGETCTQILPQQQEICIQKNVKGQGIHRSSRHG